MSLADPDAFADDRAAAWNSHYLTRILATCSEGAVFRSGKAAALVSSGKLCGKTALRTNTAAALATRSDRRFVVRDVFRGHGTLVISYENHKGVLAEETLSFDLEGRVVEVSACHRDQ